MTSSKDWKKENPERAKEHAKKCYEKNKDKIREEQVWARLKSRYGISKEEYEELVAAQNGVCAICANPCKTGQRLVVDHNHTTGKNRGLLCKSCNLHLGVLEKELWREKAEAYLEEWIEEM